MHKAQVRHDISPVTKSQTVSLENICARHNGNEADKSSTPWEADGHSSI